MPTEVVDVLKAARKRQIEDRLVAGSQYRGGEYVASNQLGEPLHPDAITSRWEKLLKDLGIPAVRLHDARHSCATLMHLRGVPIAVIAAWLGHASRPSRWRPTRTARTTLWRPRRAVSVEL